uniref:Peptidase S33 tripeptidyl aminopeptidase-like C-terminal domain-containing protein n=1 Tax=Peronospora matthiolae TaxID=2874970 RepID=A0AAV1TSP6_9STRA
MHLHHALSIVAAGLIGQTSAVYNTSSELPLNGWHACSAYTFAGEGQEEYRAQCLTVGVPLCYTDVCKLLPNVYPTINVFVKMLPATGAYADHATNVWMFASGASSEAEASMVTLHKRLNGSVNVLTMDLRGTGRSSRLDCVSSQAMTSGSPSGADIDLTEVAACARELQNKYGDLASFSVTSAAMDVVTLLPMLANGASNIMYGRSLTATLMIQRLMQMNPLGVTGYVLDSPAASVVPLDKKTYWVKGDVEFNEVSEHFLELCSEYTECSSHFKTDTLPTTLHDVMSKFDKDPNSTCATLVRNFTEDEPSSGLRRTLGGLARGPPMRSAIPPVIYRLNRCEPSDVEILTHFFTIITQDGGIADDALISNLFYQMNIFSEMSPNPMPTYAELEAQHKNLSISYLGMYDSIPLYCAYTKDPSPVCKEYTFGNYEANPIAYSKDHFWNEAAVVSSEASVLLLSGKLDVQAHHKYSEYIYEALETSKKELVVFDFSGHVTLEDTAFGESETSCAMELLASFVSCNGDLARLDKSCMAKMPAFDMTVPAHIAENCFGITDVYDGTVTTSGTPA